MTRHKARPPSPAAAKPGKAEQNPARSLNPLLQPDTRWQRTVRFGWDKGGSRGGRK